jgi:hypothetical protein
MLTSISSVSVEAARADAGEAGIGSDGSVFL